MKKTYPRRGAGGRPKGLQFCRAGFAGRGTALARSTERHTLAFRFRVGSCATEPCAAARCGVGRAAESMWYLDRSRSCRPSCKLALVFLAPLLLGAWPGCSPKPAANDDEALMKAGLEALQTRHDPETAIADFRKVLEHAPDHYGATFQLAAALEAAGRRDEARPLWEKMVAMADRHQDIETAATARAHLAGEGSVGDEATMQAGLDALYKRHDPAEAIVQFRKVLESNPTHYGAT